MTLRGKRPGDSLRKYFFVIFFLGALLPPWTPIWAEEPKAYRSQEVLVEENPTQGPSDQPTAFATVLYPKDYSSQLITLPELLSQQVGIFVKGFGGLGQLSTISIRGSTAEQVSVFIDGIKINTAQGGAVDFSTIPLGGIERIEIIRGGGSSRYGNGAIGGVINIITKQAAKKMNLEFKLSGGSFLTFETHEGFSKRMGKLGLTLDHTHLSSKGNFSFLSTGITLPGGETVGGGQEFTREHNSFFSEGFLSKLDWDLNDKMRLIFLNDFFYTDRDEPGPEIETTQLLPQNPLEAKRKLFRDTVGFQFHWADMGVPNLSFSFYPNYDVERNHFTDPTPALGPPIDVTFLNQAVGARPELLYEIDFPHHSHVFTFFYDFRYNHYNDSSPLPGANLSGKHTRRTHALFFQNEISLLGEKLILNPSARFENTNDFGNHFAMHFGILGRPAKWVELKGNVERSFRVPTFDELYFPDQGFIRGNPDLMAESAIGFDVGAGFHYRWARVEVDYFRNDIDNSIVFVPISAFTIEPLNSGPVTEQGLEASLYLRPVSFMEISGNYTFLDAQLDGSGQQLPGRPRHLANGQLRFEWKYGGVFARIQYIDRLPIDFVNTRFIRNRALVDVGGTFKWKDRYFVTVEGKNVGNVQTFDSVGFPLPRASVFATFGYKS